VEAGAAALASTGLIALALVSSAPAADGRTQFERRFGLTPVQAFRSTELDVRPGGRDLFFQLGSVSFPAGARQGPDEWYVGKLHFTVTLARLAAGSRVYVSADVGTRTFAQVELEPVRTPRGSALRWSAYDVFTGDTSRVVRGRTAEVSFYNYLQDKSVRPGRVGARLHLEQFKGAGVARLVVHPDSAIEATRRAPTPLALTIEPLDARPTVGDSFRIKVAVAPKTRADVLRRVSIEPVYDASSLRLDEPRKKVTFAVLRGPAAQTFTFEALRPGRHQVGFLATSNINSPRGALLVDVAPAEEGWAENSPRWIGLGLLLAGVVLVGLVVVRRHREPTSRPAG
jgi:hypothetical protein